MINQCRKSGYRIVRRSLDREVQVGDFLMEVAPLASQAAAPAGGGAPGRLTRELRVTLEHGLHARPAALLAAALKTLAADVRVAARGREANARSTTALAGPGRAAGRWPHGQRLGAGCGRGARPARSSHAR